MWINAGTLDIHDEACKEMCVMAAMTDRLKSEPVASLTIHSAKQVPAKP